MGSVLLTKFAVFFERKLLLDLLLVALGVMGDPTAYGTLQFGHVFLNLAHKNKINMIQRVRALLYVSFEFSSTPGAICRARTDDPRFTKPLLYQLS